jgi:hypothetical protein
MSFRALFVTAIFYLITGTDKTNGHSMGWRNGLLFQQQFASLLIILAYSYKDDYILL